MSAREYLRDPFSFHGRVEMRPFASEALRGNALGDPSEREVPVYLPPGHSGPGAGFPVIFLLAGFTARGHELLETHPWKRGPVQRFDRAVAEGRARPAILVLPDAFTSLGGSQYVDSSAVGRYATYVADELVAWVDERYPTRRDRRGVAGKSSGGFGALHLAMTRPGVFRAAASIAGDCCFEHCYAARFLDSLRVLAKWDGDPAAFLRGFRAQPELTDETHSALELVAMSACYSPNPESALGFDLPVDTHTGERVPEVWRRWLAFDPLHACDGAVGTLRELEWLYIECGKRDEFHLQFATRVLVDKLRSLEIACEHVEFDGGHFGTDARWERLLTRLAGRLWGETG